MDKNHFQGKTPLAHVAEKQVEGRLLSKELHGLEMSGTMQAGTDAARDTALATLLVFSLLINYEMTAFTLAKMLAFFLGGFIIWKTGRAAWLAWGRLERLHRIMAQEKWEIEHNRPDEREELVVLYGAKGFEGKLLTDVVDVLMADEARLLKVMIEEEMGLSVENTEHPLKQGLGAFVGAMVAAAVILLGALISLDWGVPAASFLVIAAASYLTAKKSDNRPIDAVVWSLGLAALAWSATYFAAATL